MQGRPRGIVRQKGKREGSRDLLSIPRAASHKEQKLIKLAKDRKATRNPCRGWGWSCFWPAHHSMHIPTGDETALLWPPDMPHARRQGRGE